MRISHPLDELSESQNRLWVQPWINRAGNPVDVLVYLAPDVLEFLQGHLGVVEYYVHINVRLACSLSLHERAEDNDGLYVALEHA